MIELDEARELLKRAMETKGRDFRYVPKDTGGEGCYYEPRPDLYPPDDPRAQTGCLVGVALGLKGIDAAGSVDAIDALADSLGLSWSAGRYFRVAQEAQDDGYTWGQALDDAEEWAEVRAEREREYDGDF